jgi:hypothetical protein
MMNVAHKNCWPNQGWKPTPNALSLDSGTDFFDGL